MSNFRIGQKLVCIEVDDSCTAIKLNEIYTFSGDGIFYFGYQYICLIGIDHQFRSDAFRPVDDTFGPCIAEIIEKQLELETVEA